ncbi:ATP-binding protein [Polaribacter sp. Asnod1-A03]|uniref:tetratricopeptide repeat-containing sensor histidine kinase n=1 Tax=Polaribacter sp. Asnod1-A03 TaxID=3160581 RepID=UPI00386EB542
MLIHLYFKFKKLQIIIFLICSFSYGQNTKLDSAYFYFKKGKEFDYKNKHFKSYSNFIKSLDLYKNLDLKDSIAKCNLELFELITSQNNLEDNSKPYLDEYYNYALEKKDSLNLLKAANRYAQYFWNADSVNLSKGYYLKGLELTKNKKLSKYKVSIYSNLAYLHTKKYPDTATRYYNKALELKKFMNNDVLAGTYINYSIFLKNQKKYNKAIEYLKKAEAIEIEHYKLKYNKIIYRNLANTYKLYGKHKNAYEYYEKYNIARDSLNNTAQNIAISDLNIKYETEKKEKLNLQLEIDKEKQQNQLIASLVIIFLGSIISILLFKNSTKKRKVAEQQKELETQKNITLIKEQEISTINAMVNGQEKERKQIAEDLHDNLGSVLATLKLHFDNLKINNEKKKIDQKVLFDKTEKLIDEAYLKVRSIAHAKNAGVIANEGLLTAVQMMAEKISSADKIQIDVVDFGLNKRLDNSLEISVFRIIQELVTNIIKHAEAKNATINISLYDKNLNIIIEDDGKGFDINKVNLNNGMGISSIKTRVTHLNGNFKVDSTLGKGSSIILDIPVN